MSVSDHTIVIIWVVKIFFVQFCVFLPPLLNIVCFCYSLLFLSFVEPIFAWSVPLVYLIFLKRSLVFLILLFSSISFHWSLRKAFLCLLAILLNCAFKWVYLCFSLPFFSQLFVRPPLTAILLFSISFFWYVIHPIFVVTFKMLTFKVKFCLTWRLFIVQHIIFFLMLIHHKMN